MATRLRMSFLNSLNRTTSMSLDDPKADLTPTQVQAVMDDIIAKNIFNSSGGDLVSVKGAEVVTTTVNELI
ncbi:MAG: DUF2922 domain-containing protein [Tissierellales bacterium]|jgi:hypothetical protein|nr:DUF2922 domain-containing protein [Tissierellales bacterium]HCX03223.1 DUF2922 domain-containing protein [Clostridiales bacterium]